MKNWLSKLLANADEVSQTSLRINLVLAVASLLSLPLYGYLALQSGAWQMYMVLATIIVFLILSLLATSLAVRNHGKLSMAIGLLSLAAVIPILVAMISGLGMVLAVSDMLVFVVISGQTMMRERTRRALAIGVVSTAVTLIVDLYASWERASFPLLQTYLPIIAVLVVGALSIFALRQFTDYSLRTKLIISFLLVALIPLGGTFLLTNRNTRQILTDDANIALGSVAASTADAVDGFIVEGLTDARNAAQLHILEEYLALSPAERTGSETETVLYRDLRAIASRDPVYITSVGLIDAHGKDIADTYLADIGLDKTDRTWFKTPIESGTPYLSPLEFSEALGQYSLYFSAPVRNTDGEIIGVLRVRYNATIFQKIVANTSETANISDSFIVLLDEDHIRVGHSSDPNLILKSVVPFSPEKLAQLQETRRLPADKSAEDLSTNIPELEAGINNVDSQPIFSADLVASGKGLDQATVVRLKNLPWFVVVVQPIDTFLAPAQEQTRAATLLALLIASLVAAAGFFVAQTLSAPIVRLTAVAEQVSAGDLSAQAKVESQDEIGALASTFNAMTKQIGDLISTLEQRVADRTKALQTSTEVSRRLSTILEQKRLVTEVVEQVRNAFNYYHAHIYFYDDGKEELVMAGGTGEAGATMLARGHKIPKGRGLVGRSAESNQPVLVADTTQDPNWLPNPLLPETKSEAAIPISIGDQVLGVLDVQNNIVGSLKREDVDVLQSIANQVAIAMQNIRQYEGAQKIATDLGVVASVGIATSTITDADRLLQEVVDLSKRSFNLYHAHIYMLNDAGDTLELAAGAGEVGRQMVKEGRSISLDSDKSLVARAARTREGVVVNDVSVDPDFLPNPLLPETRSEMAVPMLVGGKVIGVLDVQSELINRFTEIDVNIETTLASQVAIAIQNARSFLQAQRKAEYETTVNLIGQRIQSATTIEAALQVTARELGRALGNKQTLVALDRPNDHVTVIEEK